MTLLFNAATGQVRPMRSKEESHDYRYFPDPDLPPLVLDAEWIAAQRAALPELPERRAGRGSSRAYGLAGLRRAACSPANRRWPSYFETVVAAGVEPKTAANWVMGEVMTSYNETGAFPVEAGAPGGLIALVREGVRESPGRQDGIRRARSGARRRAARRRRRPAGAGAGERPGRARRLGGRSPRRASRRGGALPGGETKLMGFFVGQVMKRSKGKADPKGVQPVLQEKLG